MDIFRFCPSYISLELFNLAYRLQPVVQAYVTPHFKGNFVEFQDHDNSDTPKCDFRLILWERVTFLKHLPENISAIST